MALRDDMQIALENAFNPSQLEVVDDSDSHIGHAGHDGKGESHFNILIRAEAFAHMTRVARHRAVHKALGDIVPRVHALSLDIGV